MDGMRGEGRGDRRRDAYHDPGCCGTPNALVHKSLEALSDIMHADFPSEEERDVATSRIYMDLAIASKRLAQFDDVIKYETMATLLGGPNDFEHLICDGYHWLRAEEDAARSCDQAIRDRPNVTYAYYWRGIAHKNLQQTDAALADLTVVADSENDFRSSAALAMATIYLDRKDMKGAGRT
jgi:hypothetical protein